MKKKKLYLTAFLLVLALALQGGIFSGFSVPVQAAATSKKQTGFVKKNGSWYYYDKNGKLVTGWFKDGGNEWYYADEDGKLVRGWFNDGGNDGRYSGDDGKLHSDWVKVNDDWYYFD